MGWRDGEGVGRSKAAVEVKQIVPRPERLGLGADPAALPQHLQKPRVVKMGARRRGMMGPLGPAGRTGPMCLVGAGPLLARLCRLVRELGPPPLPARRPTRRSPRASPAARRAGGAPAGRQARAIQTRTPCAPSPHPNPQGDKPRQDLVAAPGADGRPRHRVGLDEKLVPREQTLPGPRPGKAMRVVGGRHAGMGAVVVEVLPKQEGRSGETPRRGARAGSKGLRSRA